MKTVIVVLSVLSLLVVISEAWFLDLKSGKSDQKGFKVKSSAPNSRKIILVAKNVYVPMYASDDMSSAVAGQLLPISSPVLTATVAADGRQQSAMADYSSMYVQPPPVAGPSSAGVITAYAAPVQIPAALAGQGAVDVPQQYAVYPAGYGAAGPQYVQYAGAPQMADVGTWVMQFPYPGAGVDVAGDAPYSPTGNDKETAVDGSTVSVPIETYTPPMLD